MFKSWKKKASTKVEPTENKRFSLLGSKKSRNPENHVVQDIKTYSYPLKANEQTQEVVTQPYDPTTYNSKELPSHEANSHNRLSTAPPTPIVENIPQGACIPPQVDCPVPSLNDNSIGINNVTNDIKNHEILHAENEKEQCASTLERGDRSVEDIIAPTPITILADELDQSNLVSEDNEVDKGSIYQLNSQVQRLQRQVSFSVPHFDATRQTSTYVTKLDYALRISTYNTRHHICR
ncbi:hypothetical protein K7432_014945 [Basidiobolus ranarum]|uniref:Uncharacterized protein n=1 Tax=Basidiobolus ranarum TaxID=34480 RepID=A0ABR2WH15_9FUNG